MWIDLFATSPTHSVCLHLKSVYKWAGDWSCGSSLSFCILLTSLLLFADGIVGFLKKQAGPASVVLKDNADLEKFLADQDASVVGKHLVKETFLKVFLKLFTSNILHNLKFRVFYVTHFLFRRYCRFLLLILNPDWPFLPRILCWWQEPRTGWVPEGSERLEGQLPLRPHKLWGSPQKPWHWGRVSRSL